jgi:uncharacterized protein
MLELPPLAIAACGLVTGFLVGFAVRHARLCTFGALEAALIGGDWRRMKVFGLALAIAILTTQGLILTSLFDPARTTYVPLTTPWLAALLGGGLFGLGMALVGTCAFGTLLRLGGGDLRALITLLVFGAVSYAALRGILVDLRLELLERVTFPAHGGDLPGLIGSFTPVFWPTRLLISLGLAGFLLWAFWRDPRLHKSWRAILAAIVLGLGVTGGWLATGVLADPFDPAIKVQSLTFVSPVAKALYAGLAGLGDWLEFSVMSVFGVLAGAWLAAYRLDEIRWEAFDDPREMQRHLVGACLMGFGGVLAGGCTIGQGISAGSLMALSWPFALLGIGLGARLGIAILMEGGLRQVIAIWSKR